MTREELYDLVAAYEASTGHMPRYLVCHPLDATGWLADLAATFALDIAPDHGHRRGSPTLAGRPPAQQKGTP